MPILYRCKECQKIDKNRGKICAKCFGIIERVSEDYPKKENPMNKEMVIKFLKSQQFITQKFGKDKRVFEKYKYTIDFIEKSVLNDNEKRLF